MARTKHTTTHYKKAMLEALEKTLGVVTNACELAGVGRRTYYTWLEKDKKFKQSVEDINNVALDFAESKLYEKMNGVEVSKGTNEDGSPKVYSQPPSDTALIFYLKTKGKSRGYVERQEIHTEDKTKPRLTPAQIKKLIDKS